MPYRLMYSLALAQKETKLTLRFLLSPCISYNLVKASDL